MRPAKADPKLLMKTVHVDDSRAREGAALKLDAHA